MKKKYTVGTIPKSNIKIAETPNTQLHDCSL